MNIERKPDREADIGIGLTARLRRGGIWIFLGRTLGMGTVLVTTVVLSKFLSRTDFANYIVTASLVTLTAIVAMFGLNYLMCRFVSAFFAASPEPEARKTAIRIGATALVSIASCSALFLFASHWLFHALGSDGLTVYVWAIVAWIACLSISQIIAETFRGLHQLFAASVLAGISGGFLANFILLAGIIYLISTDQLSYARIVILGPLSFVVPILFGSVWLLLAWPRAAKQSKKSGDPSASRLPNSSIPGILREAFPIMILNMSAYGIDQSGQLIAKGFGTDLNVNTYESIWKLGFLIVVPLTMLGLASASTMAEQYSVQNRRVLQKVLRSVSTISFLVAVPLYLMLIFFGGSIITILFRDTYAIGAVPLMVLATVQILRSWAGPCDVALIMTGHQWWALFCYIIAAPILFLGPWAVQNHGVLGITLVVSCSLLVSRMSQYLVLRHRLKVKSHANLQPAFITGLLQFATPNPSPSYVTETIAEKIRS